MQEISGREYAVGIFKAAFVAALAPLSKRNKAALINDITKALEFLFLEEFKDELLNKTPLE